MSILVFNAGSSSLKFGLFDDLSLRDMAEGLIDWTSDPSRAETIITTLDGAEVRGFTEVPDYGSAVDHALELLAGSGIVIKAGDMGLRAMGHRVVHGGRALRKSVFLDGGVRKTIRGLSELAPLHNPPALEVIEAAEAALPEVPHVAVFDTAYYSEMPPEACVYPLPYEWYEQWGVRRFGFHGISHAYAARRAAGMLDRDPAELRIISCHLGNGCSVTATDRGVAVATTMGFTPLDGLMMGTRPGSIDPGILLYVQKKKGLSVEELEDVLNNGSGLLGISGVSSDFRRVTEAALHGNERASLALEIFHGHVRSAIGALAVGMGGIDVLVFTAGIGEHSPGLRASVCKGLECLGVGLDKKRNDGCGPEDNITATESQVQVLVIRSREDLLIAGEVSSLMAARVEGDGAA